jgi:hypothetical protein
LATPALPARRQLANISRQLGVHRRELDAFRLALDALWRAVREVRAPASNGSGPMADHADRDKALL